MGKLLDRELRELKERVAAMARSVQQSLGAAVVALLDADVEAARVVCQNDDDINEERFALERDAVSVIATQQPVAGDVRLLVAILEIATELERMGDYAKDIARIGIRQADQGKPACLVGLAEMADQAASMLERASQAFLSDDAGLARSVAAEDDGIDRLCETLHRGLLEQAHQREQAIGEAIRLIPAVHNVERFADRITNICERIVYITTGELVEFDDRRSPE